jgi:NADH dehydrogenase
VSRVKGYDNIFAVGDVAAMISEAYPKGHPMIAPVAMQQGRHLGENLLKMLENEEVKPFEYHDRGALATIGRNRAVADLRRWKLQGTFAWFVWMAVHLMSLVGFRNKLMTFINWLYGYFSYDRALRLIIPRKKTVEKTGTPVSA